MAEDPQETQDGEERYTLRMNGDSYGHYIGLAKQFLPDIDLERDHVAMMVDPYVAVVERRKASSEVRWKMDQRLSQHAREHEHYITHDRYFDVVAWQLHGHEARHVIRATRAEGSWRTLLQPGPILVEALRYVGRRYQNDGDNRMKRTSEICLLSGAPFAEAENDAKCLISWFEFLRRLDSYNSLVLTLDAVDTTIVRLSELQ